jgi:hypothetical protein
MLVPSASKDHISFVFNVKQSNEVSGSTQTTTQHNIQQELNLQQVSPSLSLRAELRIKPNEVMEEFY